MDPAVVAGLIETIGFLVVVAVLAMMTKRLFSRAIGSRRSEGPTIAPSGGWSDLAARFGVERGPEPPLVRGATLMVGPVVWKNCVAVGAEVDGLRLAVKMPLFGGVGKAPLRIPWDEIVEIAPARLHWGAARLVVVGRPTVATLTLPETLFQAIAARGHLGADLAASARATPS
ncbi:hypothetical protein [Pinisolibacter aquiterrae]|uniref:hypothetical protein n=1 Tax=Pinisolibacter aquiterrae TaxID=2815579 RepID=UPI001C3C7283|nr:hypothetical protein [Pinisolibacter aquiterrae]MBV5263437.1 hypothetical protein [Pinisolibacter aquiterrae]MCC8237486.1 hypothetical protein [Pinisolibacter aquiterrae]